MFKKYIFILILFIASIARAEIIEVDSLNKIKQDFKENYNKNYVPQDLLVVTVLDEFLFKSLVPIVAQLDKDIYLTLTPLLRNINKNSKTIYIKQLILTNDSYKKELQESDFPNFVNEISNSKIPIIAVNDGFTGNFNNIPKFEIWFADYLKKNFDIDFSNSFPNNNYIIFNNLDSFANTYPVFYKGILTSNNISEAEMILNFLIQMNFIPKCFIMISSSIELLSSMELQLNSYSSNILFIGYHYNNKNTLKNKDVAYYTKLINDLISQINKLKRNNPPLKNNNAKGKNPYDTNK
ncbi:hypothetical protein RHHCN13_02170 [Rickettsia conorii subsp. heilongjiangensis]|uniref:Uncharacterized protein n=1 Tax=Rickettsia conorii subsp. heilongjiangensis TaxID=226665 RepID=A0AAD1LSI5_RICCR|nr:DUF2608 domain-containing protein [Rickettsia conorii]AEK74444.1 hypothetical protein Rh054_02285 [Rickettsia conorii subsp. heilongjiangensis 054]BBM91217.1 hypothetical protein RHCH81_02170 [Rickettsia conorii subsp. heilongjiangensis]BBM92426.1 hypothetical protein RHHCN13_02170 [Rickettsia conorii subsp. heilongjiangensis]BBM93635.1 hypothetical protein RHSENDAI29_02170 [Rickettsia conorii subsp. heilongjiangensis]BBM94844.1 hypothetical protein RHSENDAI58_02170 [Rickettsia conorii subs